MEQDNKVFHDGEAAVQSKANVPASHIEMAQGFIRSKMPMQHRTFFQSLPALYMGFLDTSGRVWASPVYGRAGFMTSPDADRLNVSAKPVLAQELDLDLREGAKVGAVGVELHTRRRNRMNGTLSSADNGTLSIRVDQSFGNCPQYIQARSFDWDMTNDAKPAPVPLATWDDKARALIAKADTFFIASRTKSLSGTSDQGVDASHRGGRPGFLGINEDGSLSFPDFSGNRFFNTLGNIQDDGRVGLFIPDFETGNAVFVTGHASIDWDQSRIGSFEGAERIIDIVPDEIWFGPQSIPAQKDFHDSSPVLLGTGTWNEAKLASLKSDGYRGLRVTAKQPESSEVTSFYLKPADNGPLAPHEAGQFLPIRIDGRDGPVMRSYTLSQAANGREYRISVKREDKGVMSQQLHSAFNVGDIIEARAPVGDFTLDQSDQPIVFLSAGVGITPMIAMLDRLEMTVRNGQTPRDVWFIHGARNGQSHAFKSHLNALRQKYRWLTVHTVYSNPLPSDVLGQTHDGVGHITIDTLQRVLPFGAYQFYLCGPEAFMRSLYAGLRTSGIDKSHIHYEFFGAGTIADQDEDTTSAIVLPDATKVVFASAESDAVWTAKDGTLLEFAEKAGLKPAFNCRSGKCGTCAVKLLDGNVQYPSKPLVEPPEGTVLTCCAVPASSDDLVLDI